MNLRFSPSSSRGYLLSLGKLLYGSWASFSFIFFEIFTRKLKSLWLAASKQMENSTNNQIPLRRLDYKKTVTSILGVTCPAFPTWLLWEEPAVILRAALWMNQHGKGLRNASSRKETEAFSPVSPRNWILPRATWTSLEADLPPVKLSDETRAPMTDCLQPHSHQHPDKLHPDFWDNKCFSF